MELHVLMTIMLWTKEIASEFRRFYRKNLNFHFLACTAIGLRGPVFTSGKTRSSARFRLRTLTRSNTGNTYYITINRSRQISTARKHLFSAVMVKHPKTVRDDTGAFGITRTYYSAYIFLNARIKVPADDQADNTPMIDGDCITTIVIIYF